MQLGNYSSRHATCKTVMGLIVYGSSWSFLIVGHADMRCQVLCSTYCSIIMTSLEVFTVVAHAIA